MAERQQGGVICVAREVAQADGARIRLREEVPLAQGPELCARHEAGAARVSPARNPRAPLGNILKTSRLGLRHLGSLRMCWLRAVAGSRALAWGSKFNSNSFVVMVNPRSGM